MPHSHLCHFLPLCFPLGRRVHDLFLHVVGLLRLRRVFKSSTLGQYYIENHDPYANWVLPKHAQLMSLKGLVYGLQDLQGYERGSGFRVISGYKGKHRDMLALDLQMSILFQVFGFRSLQCGFRV